MQKRHRRTIAGAVVAGLALTGGLAGTASALFTSDAGGAQVEIHARTDNVASSTSSLVYADIPNAAVTLTVPAGQGRLVHTSFTGASRCSGLTPAGLVPACRVRVVATNVATGATHEFNPRGGIGFFDSDAPGSADDMYESHAMDRSLRLATGTYRIRAQRAVSHASIAFRLDDWHFTVRANA
jgi:hypothetical protein